jgi:O-antigen/teichoic acid export membrane protein
MDGPADNTRAAPSSSLRTAIKPVAVLLSGGALAQALPLVLSPVMTRLYTPENYGAYALAVSVVTVAVVLATGRYDLSINVEREDNSAFALMLGVIAGGLVGLVLLAFIGVVEYLVRGEWLHRMWYVPVATGLTVVFSGASAWSNRQQRFRAVAQARVVLAVVAVISTLALGWAHSGDLGLMLGNTVGLVACTLWLAGGVLRQDGARLRALRGRMILGVLASHRRFPIWQLPATLIGTAAAQVPVWFMERVFGAQILGQYALVNRVLQIPVSLVGASAGEVFRQRSAAEYHEHGNCRRTFSAFGWCLAAAAVLPAVILLFFGPRLFAMVFGENWRVAGQFAQILSVLFAFRFVVSPLTHVVLLTKRQSVNLTAHSLFLGAALFAWWWGARTGSSHQALAVISGATAVIYSGYFIVCRGLARGTGISARDAGRP